MRVKSSGLFGVSAAMALAGFCAAASAQPDAAKSLLESAAAAMGGLERLQRVENFALTGWGQQLYFEGGGNVSPDPNAPPKWRAVADAQRTFDLRNERAVNQERRSFMFPFAAPFGHSWTRTDTVQTGADMLDHPLPALLEALDPETTLGAVTVEDGLSVVQFTIEDGTPLWLAVDPVTHLPAWTRRIMPHANLGDVAVTSYYTGYVPYAGVQLPLGLMSKIDWRDQTTLMFQVDSYRVDLPQAELPAALTAQAQPGGGAGPGIGFGRAGGAATGRGAAAGPAPGRGAGAGPGQGRGGGPGAGRGAAAGGGVAVTQLADSVWDVRVNNNGGPIIELDDHLVMFEAGGSAAATLARIDAGNALVPGKEVKAVIVSHHHFDHTAGLRAAVSRGLAVISHRGNEGIIREMIERPAVVFPDELARNPQPLTFIPVDEHLALYDGTQKLDIYHVLGHSHMANAVLAYLPDERIMMEGDLGDASWTWHWWAGSFAANIEAYGLEPRLNVAVHGEPGGLSIEETLAKVQAQSEAAQQFCAEQVESGIYFFGCPVQYDASGPLSGVTAR